MTSPATFNDIIIRGMHHRGAFAKQYVAALEPGDILHLEREPDNQHDSNAIKVLTPEDHQHIGYIGGEHTQFIAYYIDEEGANYHAELVRLESSRNNLYPIVTLVLDE